MSDRTYPKIRRLVACLLVLPAFAGCGPDLSEPVGQLQGELSAADPDGHLVRLFEELPRALTYSVPEGNGTGTLLPSGNVYRSVKGRLTFPVDPHGSCVKLQVVEGRSSGLWTLAVKQRGAVLDCEADLADVWGYKDPNDGLPVSCPDECSYCYWKWNGPGQGWTHVCVEVAPGW